MTQTFTRILVHVVFSTKNRHDLITPEIEGEKYVNLSAVRGNREEDEFVAIAERYGGSHNARL